MKKNIVIFILVVVIGAILLYKGESKKMEVIRVADPRAIGWSPFYVALEKGYFSEQNLDVQVSVVQTGDESLKAVIGNSADLALAGIIPYSFTAFDYPEMKLLAQNAYVHDTQVSVNTERGIHSPEDLKGKKIGYAQTTASDIGAELFLKKHNIAEHEVTLVNMKPLAAPAALAGGEIDAYVGWEPHTSNIKKALGEKFLLFSNPEDTYTWHASIIAKSEYIGANKDTLTKFVRAWKKAEEFMKNSPREAIVIVAEYSKLPAESIEQVWFKYNFELGIMPDTLSILETDLAWANTRRNSPVVHLPSAKDLISNFMSSYER